MRQSRVLVGALSVALVVAGLTSAPRVAVGAGGGGAGGSGGGTTEMGSVKITQVSRTTQRLSDQNPDWISYKDCKDNVTITFTVTNSAVDAKRKLYGYLSRGDVDCLNYTTRQDPSYCILLTQPDQKVVQLNAADIVTKLSLPSDCGDGLPGSGNLNVDAKIYFMFIDPTSKAAVADVAIWNKLTVDIWGPAAPVIAATDKDKALVPGDGFLTVNFDLNSDAQSYKIYRDPPPSTTCTGDAGALYVTGSGGAGGASSSSAASGAGGAASSSNSGSSSTGASSSGSSGSGSSGSGAGGATGSGASSSTGSPSGGACSSTLLVEGKLAPACLETAIDPDPTSSPQTIDKDLINGTTYAIAIAGVDQVGNIGPLSNVVCGAPLPANTFWKEYCQDKGAACVAGGCGCSSVGADSKILWPTLASIGFAAAGISLIRRRRGRAARRRPEAP